ncbi:MAG: hypothetical protein ACRDLQ_07045 [Solirubrobacterales bacterium]
MPEAFDSLGLLFACAYGIVRGTAVASALSGRSARCCSWHRYRRRWSCRRWRRSASSPPCWPC